MRVKIFLPHKLKKNTEEAHHKVASLLIDQAGGFTRTSGQGYWRDKDKLVIEDVYIYEAYAQSHIFDQKEIVKTLLILRAETNETSIAYVFDNEIHFI